MSADTDLDMPESFDLAPGSDTDLAESDTPADSVGSFDTDLVSDSEQQPGKPSGRRSARASAKAPRGQRGQVRKIAERTLQIADAPESERAILAALLGADDSDTVALTVAAVSSAKADAPAQDLVRLADADPMEAGLLAAELCADRAKARAVWVLLSALGMLTGEAPKESAKAGLAIARAAQQLTPPVRSDLTSALTMLG